MPLRTVQELAGVKVDYIVVGGGTAGLVVAARLTEDPNCVVCVLEAGAYHKDNPKVNIPGFVTRGVNDPELDWSFYNVPGKDTNNRPIFQPRGKGLGGSSLLNFTTYVRPAKKELDALEALGNPGWNWDSLLKYMMKSENLQPPDLSEHDSKILAAKPDPKLHGSGGAIATSWSRDNNEVHIAFMDAFEKLGVPRNAEPAGGQTIGCFIMPTTVDSETKTRSYSASGYYAPNADRPNLLVLTESRVTKILLELSRSGLKRASGVEFVKDGKSHRLETSKEVVVSAGTFQSPQILELSGIGNEDILKRQMITTHIDLPGVGENLQDHATLPVIVEIDKKIPTMEQVMFSETETARQMELYKEGMGIFTSMPCHNVAFVPAETFANNEDNVKWISMATLQAAPELFADTPESVKKGIQKQYEWLAKWVDDPTAPMAQVLSLLSHFPMPGLDIDPSKHYLSIFGCYVHPFTRGSVHIKSSSVFDQPAIKQNYLSQPADMEVMKRFQYFLLKLCETEPAKQLIREIVLPPKKYEDEKDMEEHIRNNLSVLYHPVGTCSMLPRDLGGVVDSKLKVYGTENLRVVDCSILPMVPSCNTQSLAYAIGEKGADIIRGLD